MGEGAAAEGEDEGQDEGQISPGTMSPVNEAVADVRDRLPKRVKLQKNQYLVPDPTAQNNAFCPDSGDFLHRKCQELNIPLIIFSRHASYACPVTKYLYDSMKATNSAVGHRLHHAQKSNIESLWKRANMAPDDPDRKMLPSRCDRKWFRDTFCGGVDPKTDAEVWNSTRSFNMNDPLALVATIPALRERFFEPKIIRVKTQRPKQDNIDRGFG